MNAAHWHLAMNHVPVVGALFATCLLAFALWRKSGELIRSGLGAFVATALACVPVYLTGEPAENVLMDLADFSQELVGPHEKAATLAFIAIGIAGAVSLGGLIFFRGKPQFPRWLAVVVLGLGLVATGLLGRTANLGGMIRHPEIRAQDTPAVAPAKGERE
jgi:hypothetical protein